MSKLSPIWAAVQFVWSIRRIIAIISMLTAIVYLLTSETLEQRRTMVEAFGKADKSIALLEGELKRAGDTAFREPSRSGGSVAQSAISELYADTQALRSALATLNAPTSDIELSIRNYTSALSDLLGALNLFQPGAEGTIAVLTALDEIEQPAAQYREAANTFLRSTWVSFWAAF